MKNWRWLLLILPLKLIAQPNTLQTITIADGLSQGMVFSMLQDRAGFIWIGTKNGLNRFDGYNYQTFFQNPWQQYSISEDQASALHEDRMGRIWVGTISGGLNLYQPETQRFYHASFETLGNQPGKKNINQPISSITSDSQGRVWIGTQDGKMVCVTIAANWKSGYPTGEDFTKDLRPQFVAAPLQELANGAVSFVQTKQNGLLAIIGKGLYAIDTNSLQLTTLVAPLADRMRVCGVHETPDGALLIAQTHQVALWKNGTLVKTLLSCDPGQLPLMNYVDGLGNVWGIRNNKIYRQHYTQLNNRLYQQEPVASIQNSGYFICNLLDNQQQVWLGTNGFGIKKWGAMQRPFRHVLAGSSVWQVYQDKQGRTFSWEFVRAYLLDTLTGKESEKEILPQYAGRNKGRMLQDTTGNYWWVIGKEDGKNGMILAHLDTNLHTIKEYDLHQAAHFQFAAIIQDRNGIIWLSNRYSGIIRFDPKTGQQNLYDYSSLILPGESTNGTVRIYEDINGIFWICNIKGLVKAVWDGSSLHFTLYKNEPANAQSLPNNLVTGVLDDPNQPNKWLWIATRGGGIARMEKATGNMRRFTTAQGLLSNNVVGILGDNQRHIWISTYRGISELDPKTFAFRHFTERDGLQSDEFNTGVFCKSANGELLFGGINGLNIFNPPSISGKKTQASPVKIIGLKLNNEVVLPGDTSGLLSQSVEYLPALELGYKQNQLTFEFSTLDMQNAAKVRYRYKMLGIDNGWVQSGTNRFANYAQLPAGDYTLRVQASNDGLLWTNPATELQITIHPAWYRSGWAYLGYAVVLIAVAKWAYSAQIRRIKLQNQLSFESKEAARLAEVSELKTHFFNNISHEFRTPLTLLISPMDDLKSKYPNEAVLDMMRRNGQRLLALINQLLDLGKLDAKEMQVSHTPGDLSEFITRLASSFDTVAARNSIVYTQQITPAQLPSYFDADKIDKIITNLLSNAFKFTGRGQSILLQTDFHPAKSQLHILVKDTGTGIAPDKLDKIFDRFYQANTSTGRYYEGTGIGLSLVKELVNLLQGSIRVESEEGKGTRFYIELPVTLLKKTLATSETAQQPQQWQKPEPLPLMTGNAAPVLPKPDTENLLLIVEDNHDLRAYIRSVFENTYQIVEAADGQEGVEKALETIPDIIISDLMMPRMDGLDFCKTIKTTEKTSHIPVVMLTAKGSLESRIAGFGQGADDYLTKPFNAAEIKARVAALVKNREQLRQLFSQKTTMPSEEKPRLPTMDEAFVSKANAVIDRFIGQSSFDVVRFAAEMNMTPLQLRRKLKAITNYPTIEYVRKYRLQKAAAQLAQKAATVSEVAFDVGFESLSYFSKVFQEEYGVLPSEYTGRLS